MLGFEELAREFLELVTSELDPYVSRKGEIVSSENKVALLSPSHIQFAKYGRGPGKQPPIEPLVKWAEGKGAINPIKMAWGVAINVSKNGTLNYVPNAPNAIEESIVKYQGAFLDKLGEVISMELSEEMMELEVLPVSIETFKM